VVQYAVAMKDNDWALFRDGEVLERGMSRSRTLERAEELAGDARAAGHDVELLVQEYFGELRRRRL
jgi:hypothetical protein